MKNFYLSPAFWDRLEEDEKSVIVNAIAIEKNVFPKQQAHFDIINFFDEKYKVN